MQKLAEQFGLQDIKYKGERNKYEIDDKSPSIVRDFNKCVLCRRCIATCKKVQGIAAIDSTNRGFASCISTVENHSLNDVNCTFCGQCIQNCPVGALHEKDDTELVWQKLKDKDTIVIAQTAPAVRVGLGEEFSMPIGTNVDRKMVTALKKLGFDKVFDTNTGADFTIMEEASEFIDRIKNGGVLPMTTSCCPAWIRFIEMNYPEFLDHLSSCKSPHQMFGAIIKSYYAKKNNIDPSKIFVVSVMPCVAKKFERTRDDMQGVEGLACFWPSARSTAACFSASARRMADCFSPSATRIWDCFWPSAWRMASRRSRSARICFSMESWMSRGGMMFFSSTRFTLIPQGSVASSRMERIWVLMWSRLVRDWSSSRSPMMFRRVVAVRFSMADMGCSTP